jgi:hypothetical protein
MRAPPDDEMMMSGHFFSSERWPRRAIFSPTTEPIDPPMNAKSMMPRFTGIWSIRPETVRIASCSPAFLSAFFKRLAYSGNSSGSTDESSTSFSSIDPSSSRIVAYSCARMRR